LQHPPRKFVLNERAIPWDGLKSGFVQRFPKQPDSSKPEITVVRAMVCIATLWVRLVTAGVAVARRKTEPFGLVQTTRRFPTLSTIGGGNDRGLKQLEGKNEPFGSWM
jgi:hypothetical protein